MTKDQKFIKTLEQKITKDFGKKCKDFSVLCSNCIVWRAIEDIKEMYEIDKVRFIMNEEEKKFTQGFAYKPPKPKDCKSCYGKKYYTQIYSILNLAHNQRFICPRQSL